IDQLSFWSLDGGRSMGGIGFGVSMAGAGCMGRGAGGVARPEVGSLSPLSFDGSIGWTMIEPVVLLEGGCEMRKDPVCGLAGEVRLRGPFFLVGRCPKRPRSA